MQSEVQAHYLTRIFLNLKHSAKPNFVFRSLQCPRTHRRTHTHTKQKRGSLQHWSMAGEKLSFQTGMLRVPKGRTWKKACARRVPKDTRQCSMWGQFRPDGKSGIKGPSSIIAHSPTNTVPFEERARPPVSSEKQLQYIHSSLPSRAALSVSGLDTKEREENKMERGGEKEKVCEGWWTNRYPNFC